MKPQLIKIACASLLLMANALLIAEETPPGCETVGKAQGICGFPAPEDIDVMPAGKHLLLSAFGGIDGEYPQAFHLFNTETLTASPISYQSEKTPARWDNGQCKTAPDETLGSHGIDISQRPDGSWQLLAVNHIRESIEMYEIINPYDQPTFAWRGCAITPAKTSLNDVTALPSGGFLATHMVERGLYGMVEAMNLKTITGHVLRWRLNQGFDILPGSKTNIPNSVAISADEHFVFISETGVGTVRKIDYHSGKTLGSIPASAADNFSWTTDGQLIVSGINGPMPEDCMTTPGPCLAPFQVQSINPDTMEATVLWQQNGPPMGAGTVAVKHSGYLYIGSFKGNQLMRVKLAE